MDLSLYLTKRMMQFIQNNASKSEEELEIIQYGIEVFFINLFKFLLLLGVAWMLGIVKPLGILFLSFVTLRIFAAGAHASSTFICTLLNIMLFLGGTLLCLYLPINLAVRISLFSLSLLLIMLYAPADTEERPLVSAKHRYKLKFQAITATTVLFFIMLVTKDETVKNLITCGVLIESIFTTPVIYFILRKGYKNYEKFNEQI